MKRNEEVWELAVRSALGTFLSDWPSDMSAVDVLDKIDSYDYEPVPPFDDVDSDDDQSILVWQPFERESGRELASYIECAARTFVNTVAEVCDEIILPHLVDLACDGVFDRLDMNTLDLRSFVREGISAANALDEYNDEI